VRILLDTHVLLWARADSARLSARARELLADPDSDCWVSASVWEIALKVGLGKHQLEFPLASIRSRGRVSSGGRGSPYCRFGCLANTRNISADR
jgi:PIN domain nuclease of toxin-antitoxin system